MKTSRWRLSLIHGGGEKKRKFEGNKEYTSGRNGRKRMSVGLGITVMTASR